MEYFFSFVVPVYNRPQEMQELLESISKLDYNAPFEMIIVEDGSAISSEAVCNGFSSDLNISYYFKNNTGPGDSRNFGMQKAKGNFFIILDSDVILPPAYLKEVEHFLKQKKAEFFGGPDAAHPNFSNLQKAINYCMTSVFTTGGLRGKKGTKKYEPRSFNMGISAEAFKKSGGFGNIHPGEDPDLSLRLKKLGFEAAFIPKAFVYHKRRIDLEKFFQQVKKFGKVRPILLLWHPTSFKLSYFFPSIFVIGLFGSLVLAVFGVFIPLILFLLYFFIIFLDASVKNRSILIGILAVVATVVQFFGYGTGFIGSYWNFLILKKLPQDTYPYLFFKND